MDMDVIKLALTVLNMLITAGVWIFVWQEKKTRVTRDSIQSLEDKVDKRFDRKCVRISKLESDFKSLPSNSEIIRIHERIDVLNQGNQTTQLMIGELIGQIKQMNQEHSRG